MRSTLRHGDGFHGLTDDVRYLQQKLNDLGARLTIDGKFGDATADVVRFVQRQYGLDADGVVGARTWSALERRTLPESPGNLAGESIGQCIVRIAGADVGLTERPGNMGFVDKVFDTAMRAIGFRDGQPWCAYWGEKAWRQGYAAYYAGQPEKARAADKLLAKLFSGLAYGTWKNFRNEGSFTCSDSPTIGALGILKKQLAVSGHLFLVSTDTIPGHDWIGTFEGNSNSAGGREGIEVAARHRRISQRSYGSLRLLGYVHPREF